MYTPTAPGASPPTVPESKPLIVAIDVDQLERLRDLARLAGWRACRLGSEADGHVGRGLYRLASDLATLALALERRLPEHAPIPGERVPSPL